MKYFDRVKVNIATLGTGDVTFGTAVSSSFLTPSQAGAVDGDVTPYVIVDGTDFEEGTMEVSASGTEGIRTVSKSVISGVVGASKLNLSGTAALTFTIRAADLSNLLEKDANLSDLADASAARDSLGLGSAALADADDFAETARGLPSGGTAGQVLAKIDGTNYNTTWVDQANDPWNLQPIGVPIPVLDNIVGVAQPPTDKSYRYIKLTASDSYNTGVLASESVTGSAPLVVATAVISLSGSPINGATVNLINTEGRFLRGSTSAGTVQNDQMQTITGNVDGLITLGTKDGAFTTGASLGAFGAPGANYGFSKASFNSSNSSGARTGTETRSKNIGVTYFMRIK